MIIDSAQYLKPEVAYSDELKNEVYRLRHKVYCEELHFEDVKENYEECDEFDAMAIHCFVRHITSDHLASAVRLISSDSAGGLLPIENFCSYSLTSEDCHPSHFNRGETCEISRLAVPAEFRKRAIDKHAGTTMGVINKQQYSETELRCFPYIAICLYLSAAAMSLRNKRYHVFVMMEPRLAWSLSFVGIVFHQLGAAIEFHGKRAPYYIDSRELKHTLSSGYLKLLQVMERSIFGEKELLTASEHRWIPNLKTLKEG